LLFFLLLRVFFWKNSSYKCGQESHSFLPDFLLEEFFFSSHKPFLAFSLYRIVGGFNSMVEFSSNFSIIVVLCFFASVVVPIFFATLHLAIHNPFMIFFIMPSESINSRMKKTVMTLLCVFLSFLNPVLLLNAYEGAKERTKSLAKSMNAGVVQQMETLKNIKYQWVTFIKIELGKYL